MSFIGCYSSREFLYPYNNTNTLIVRNVLEKGVVGCNAPCNFVGVCLQISDSTLENDSYKLHVNCPLIDYTVIAKSNNKEASEMILKIKVTGLLGARVKAVEQYLLDEITKELFLANYQHIISTIQKSK